MAPAEQKVEELMADLGLRYSTESESETEAEVKEEMPRSVVGGGNSIVLRAGAGGEAKGEEKGDDDELDEHGGFKL